MKLPGSPAGLIRSRRRWIFALSTPGKIKGASNLQDKELEKGAFACITHTGSVDNIQETYKAILKRIEENGYRIAGSAREVYHKSLGETGMDSQKIMVELQFPVRK